MTKVRNFFIKYKNSDVVFKATIWFVIVSLVDKAISVLTQPFVNRILSVDQVGSYNIFNTWVTAFKIIATFSLFCGVYEVLLVDNKEEQNQVRGSLCFLSALFVCLSFVPVFIFIKPISAYLQLRPIYIVLMFFMIFSDAVIQFYLVPLRFNYKYVKYSVFVVAVFFLKSVLTVLFSYFFVFDRVLGRIVGLILPSLLVAIVLFIKILMSADRRTLTKYWKQSVKFNIPLIPHYLSSVLLASSDKVMIQNLLGEYYVGLYSVSYSFASLSNIVFTAINNSYTPWAYRAIKEKKYVSLRARTNLIVLVCVLVCIVLMLFSPEGLYLIGGEKYLNALDVVPMLIAGTFLSSFYFIFANVEFVNKKTSFVFPITICGTCLNILLNWIFIPTFGYKAAAYTTFAGYLFIAFCHYIYSRIIAKQNIFDLKTIVALVSLLTLASYVSVILYKWHFLFRYALAVVIGIISLVMLVKILNKRNSTV